MRKCRAASDSGVVLEDALHNCMHNVLDGGAKHNPRTSDKGLNATSCGGQFFLGF
jgi:hypothetical protein